MIVFGRAPAHRIKLGLLCLAMCVNAMMVWAWPGTRIVLGLDIGQYIKLGKGLAWDCDRIGAARAATRIVVGLWVGLSLGLCEVPEGSQNRASIQIQLVWTYNPGL